MPRPWRLTSPRIRLDLTWGAGGRSSASILSTMKRANRSSYTSGGEYLTPLRIHADRPGKTLEIEWADGHVTRYDFETLRWLCPCAFCRGEAGMPGWLDSKPTLTDLQITLTDLQLVGQYAVAPTWADGHHTGFYTFERLREGCPCPADVARRQAAGHQEHRLG